MGVILKLHKENLTFNGSRSGFYSELSGFAQFARNIILERQ